MLKEGLSHTANCLNEAPGDPCTLQGWLRPSFDAECLRGILARAVLLVHAA